MTEDAQRRLTAVLAADVVGYSRLMGEDEAATLAALRGMRSGLLEPAVATHRGDIVKNMGDGWLAAFTSAADAVNCAIHIQEKLLDHDTLKLRIGLHIGDVTQADNDIYGDGVNIAARLQEIAEPGAIAISDVVRRSIETKLAATFNDIGSQELKNIADPVAAFGWGMTEVAPERALLPDKPSLAVLPFNNLSGDPDQEFFSDGITEDIINALSRIRQFYVIARNTTFAYKGQAPDVQVVAKDLGVRYVLQGSVRKAGNRIRVTAQLIEGETGNQKWAERYDRDLEDIFAVQDEITLTVVGAIEPELGKAEIERLKTTKPDDLGAWELYHRGSAHFYRRSREDLVEALEFFSRAIAIDPSFAPAYSGSANTHYYSVIFGYSEDPNDDREAAMQKAQKAVDIDPDDPFACAVLGLVSYVKYPDRALRALERSLELNPSSALNHSVLGTVLADIGRFDEAFQQHDMASRLGQRDPTLPQILARRGASHYWAGQYEEAVEWMSQVISHPNAQLWLYHALIAAPLVQLDRTDEARVAGGKVQELFPGITLAKVRECTFSGTSNWDRFVDDLRRVGVPEA
jgi:adenylate cyclase